MRDKTDYPPKPCAAANPAIASRLQSWRPAGRVAELGSFDYKPSVMMHQDDFSASGMVSVWIGDFQNDAQFDRYMNLSRDFETDFGFRINDRGIREGVVESAPKPVAELVTGFSSWESFCPAVIEAAKRLGVERATTMIVFYTVRFDPAKVKTNPNAPLRFIGSFPFS